MSYAVHCFAAIAVNIQPRRRWDWPLVPLRGGAAGSAQNHWQPRLQRTRNDDCLREEKRGNRALRPEVSEDRSQYRAAAAAHCAHRPGRSRRPGKGKHDRRDIQCATMNTPDPETKGPAAGLPDYVSKAQPQASANHTTSFGGANACSAQWLGLARHCSRSAHRETYMQALITLFGEGRDLSALQMAMRAAATFFAALVFIRISGRRSFGQRSPFDYVVAILLGATLSRVIVGASPAVPTLIASLMIVLMHRVLAWACVRSRTLESLVGGAERQLYRDGTFDDQQMSAALVTRTDVLEAVRQKLGTDATDCVQRAILERNGEISIIRKRSTSDK
jgi:Protein of unknown function (DUF421)